MDKTLIDRIVKDLESHPSKILLVENNNGFLFREDVRTALKERGIFCSNGTKIAQRVDFELRDKASIFLFLNRNKETYLDDIEGISFEVEFFLSKYCSSYHIPTLIKQPLEILNKLRTSLKTLDKQATLSVINSINNVKQKEGPDVEHEKDKLFEILEEEPVNWSSAAEQLGVLILNTIGTKHWDNTQVIIDQCNELYHESFNGVMALQNSNFIKAPKIVSHILPFLKMKYLSEKIALVVVDGLGIWQYELLKQNLKGKIKTQIINSWLPSITQLSRQAIFRGDVPKNEYRQGPKNEEKLWLEFWTDAGVPKPQVNYIYEPKEQEHFGGATKLALVYKDLDEMMHGSKDLQYLKSSTEIWLKQSSITKNINRLTAQGYKVFIATDHGNVQARGWRALNGREKLGANKSGSKSERHLEYSEKSLYEDFINNNIELESSIIQEEQAIYFKNDLSFSRNESLVTHGGAHLLEMLIPFAQITNE